MRPGETKDRSDLRNLPSAPAPPRAHLVLLLILDSKSSYCTDCLCDLQVDISLNAIED